jgi:cytochrome c-type biogenesis protein CcmH
MRYPLVLLLAVLLAGPSPAAGQGVPGDAAIEAEVRRLATELRCPRCQGVSIAESPDDLSRQMKAVIRQQLEEGRTPDEVRAYFVSRYGEWVLLKPDPTGFNLAVYLIPIAAMLLGAGVLVLRIRGWTR